MKAKTKRALKTIGGAVQHVIYTLLIFLVYI